MTTTSFRGNAPQPRAGAAGPGPASTEAVSPGAGSTGSTAPHPTTTEVATPGPATSEVAGAPTEVAGAVTEVAGATSEVATPGPAPAEVAGAVTGRSLRRWAGPGCGQHPGPAAGAGTGCPAPRPGDTAGGCTFDGAMITLVPIADAAHVVHGPIGCAGNSWDGRGSLSSGPDLYRRGLTTDLSATDVIFGGEQRLYDTVLEVLARFRPAAVFVYATCVTAMIGEDIDAVCAAVAGRTGVPVIPVPAPGFAGSKNLGNRIAGRVLLDHVIGTAEPATRTPSDVNLIGEYNVAGELWGVTPVLDRIGIRVLSCITGDARFGDIAVAHRARASMVVCSRALLGLARGLEQRHGIPWFEGSFYGLRAMRDSLRQLARLLPDPGPGDALIRRTEAVIAEEESRIAATLAAYRDRLRGARAVLYTGGVKSWSMISALQDIGVEVVASGATKSTPEDVDRMRALLGPGGQIITEGGPAQLLRVARRTGADILIAGGRNQYTAVKSRLPFLDVNQERHVPFAGYSGVVELARSVELALTNPVWPAVRGPAPWEPPRAAPGPSYPPEPRTGTSAEAGADTDTDTDTDPSTDPGAGARADTSTGAGTSTSTSTSTSLARRRHRPAAAAPAGAR